MQKITKKGPNCYTDIKKSIRDLGTILWIYLNYLYGYGVNLYYFAGSYGLFFIVNSKEG